MLQLNNSTPFAADIALFANEQGIDTLYTIVRATFKIGEKWTLMDEQQPPVQADEYWAEPESSSLKMASDFHTGKPSTDVIVLGHAYAPSGKKVQQLDVTVAFGRVKKHIRVWGDRQWQNGRISAPKPFEQMPLVYEKAFGGIYIKEGELLDAETRNPVGLGYAGARVDSELEGLALPNLEDPASLIGSHRDKPIPACFAFVAPNWMPRVSYAGTYDEIWQSQRAPYLPLDFDKRFHSMAHPDLIYPSYMQGGEAVHICNMHPQGDLHFQLPGVKLLSKVSADKPVQNIPFNLETVIVEPDKMQLSMVWKSPVVCGKDALKIKEVQIGLSR